MDEWQRVAGAQAAWFRRDGATIKRETYQATYSATRVGALGRVEARSFYTVEQALSWVGPVRRTFPGLDTTSLLAPVL